MVWLKRVTPFFITPTGGAWEQSKQPHFRQKTFFHSVLHRATIMIHPHLFYAEDSTIGLRKNRRSYR